MGVHSMNYSLKDIRMDYELFTAQAVVTPKDARAGLAGQAAGLYAKLWHVLRISPDDCEKANDLLVQLKTSARVLLKVSASDLESQGKKKYAELVRDERKRVREEKGSYQYFSDEKSELECEFEGAQKVLDYDRCKRLHDRVLELTGEFEGDHEVSSKAQKQRLMGLIKSIALGFVPKVACALFYGFPGDVNLSWSLKSDIEAIGLVNDYIDVQAQKVRKELEYLVNWNGKSLVEVHAMLKEYRDTQPKAVRKDFEQVLTACAQDDANEIKGVLARHIDGEECKFRKSLQYMLDKSADFHPQWFLFMTGRHERSKQMLMVYDHLHSTAENGKVEKGEIPMIRCDSLERQFQGQDYYLEKYMDELVSLMRTGEFFEKTGYRDIALVGISREMKKVQQERLKLKKFGSKERGLVYFAQLASAVKRILGSEKKFSFGGIDDLLNS